MPAGRPRKTLKERLRDGSYDFKKHGPLPPELAGEAPPPPAKPDGLKESGSALWDRVLETRRGGVRQSDGPALELLCHWWGVFHETRAELDGCNAGVKNAVVTRLAIATDKAVNLLAKFGMTPTDRAKVADVPAEKGPASAKVETRRPTALDKKGKPKGA